jgi:hypothetical protein
MSGKRFTAQQFTSYAAAIGTLSFLGWIAVVIALTTNNYWVNGTITQTTTTPGSGVSSLSILTTYIEGTLTYVSAKVCIVSTTVPPPAQRPSTQCTQTLFSGSPASIYVGSGCNTPAGSPYEVCNALGAMVGLTGFTTFLLAAMLILFGFTTVSAAGIAYRSSRSAESLAASGLNRDVMAPGSWLRFDKYSLDQSTTLAILVLIDVLLAIVWIITFPSGLRNVFSLIISDLVSQTTVPQNSTIAWTQNPMPGAGFWVAFGGSLAVLASAWFMYKLHVAAKDAREGWTQGMSPLFNPLEAGAGGNPQYLPPPAAAATASSSASVAVVGGNDYSVLPSKGGEN